MSTVVDAQGKVSEKVTKIEPQVPQGPWSIVRRESYNCALVDEKRALRQVVNVNTHTEQVSSLYFTISG